MPQMNFDISLRLATSESTYADSGADNSAGPPTFSSYLQQAQTPGTSANDTAGPSASQTAAAGTMDPSGTTYSWSTDNPLSGSAERQSPQTRDDSPSQAQGAAGSAYSPGTAYSPSAPQGDAAQPTPADSNATTASPNHQDGKQGSAYPLAGDGQSGHDSGESAGPTQKDDSHKAAKTGTAATVVDIQLPAAAAGATPAAGQQVPMVNGGPPAAAPVAANTVKTASAPQPAKGKPDAGTAYPRSAAVRGSSGFSRNAERLPPEGGTPAAAGTQTAAAAESSPAAAQTAAATSSTAASSTAASSTATSSTAAASTVAASTVAASTAATPIAPTQAASTAPPAAGQGSMGPAAADFGRCSKRSKRPRRDGKTGGRCQAAAQSAIAHGRGERCGPRAGRSSG